MSEEYNLADDEPYEATTDDTLEARLQALVTEHARERAELAEQISQLQEENDHLKRLMQEMEQAAKAQPANVAANPKIDSHPEHTLGLDFALQGEQDKG